MSDRFGAAALRHAALAARLLGWRPAEFWSATPAELTASLGIGEAGAPATIDRLDLKRMMDMDYERSA